MDKNCFNFSELDELEIAKEEELQRKEIQELLVNEFYDLEIEEDYEDSENPAISPEIDECEDNSLIEHNPQYDKENVYSCSNQVMQSQTQSWLPNPMTAFYGIPQNHNLINYQHFQTNNNYQREDVPINWEISLLGEMGTSASSINNNFYTDKLSYMATSGITVQEASHHSNIKEDSAFKSPHSPMKIIKRDVAIECIPINQRELDNLELLYTARGRRIEQLQTELDSEREKRIKDTRILNHKVTLLESEQKNESNQLKSYKVEMNEQRQNILEKERIIETQGQKLKDYESQLEELQGVVEVRGGVIESLNAQLSELNTHTTIARNNQKQAELLDCINHQFDTNSQRLQKEILRLSERVDEKMKEIEQLEVKLDGQTIVHHSQKRLWAEEKEQINNELDEERKNVKKLESSLGREKVNELHSQVSEVMLEKSMIEDMNFYLQEEVAELTNQLLVYENSLSLLENNESMQEVRRDLGDSASILGERRGSCPLLTEVVNRRKVRDHGLNLVNGTRKEVVSLTSRTHSLTNRLISVRKDNLEAKTNIKKLQQTIHDQNEVLFALEEKFAKSEMRLNQLQSGTETDVEKQLRNSLKTLEIVNESLELQCKSLQNQLKEANETLEEMYKSHEQMEKEFGEYKNMLEEDKIESIEEVKRACSSHYDNLREQLEISWRMEKEAFVFEERKLREELQNDLSEAVKEVDGVKKLYIELSQQKNDNQSNLTNWNEWLTKKLENQKRSLNQQFQNDYQRKITKLTDQYNLRIETLRSELEIKVTKEDKCEGSELLVTDVEVQCGQEITSNQCQTELRVNVVSVQTSESIQRLSDLEGLQPSNERLRLTVEELTVQTKQDSMNHNSRTARPSISPNTRPSISPNTRPSISPNTRLSINPNTRSSLSYTTCPSMMLPHIIRSSTPQMTQFNNDFKEVQNNNNQQKDLHSLFRSLKEELVLQLTGLSRTMQPNNNCGSSIPDMECFMRPPDSIDRIKEQLYNCILEIQSRAAVTLQEELQTSLSRVRRDLLRQLRQIIPLTLSVDGEIIEISSEKMKVLIDKVVLILDRFHDDNICGYIPSQDFRTSFNSNNNAYLKFSATSTPLMSQTRHKGIAEVQSDTASICSDLSFDLSPTKEIIRTQVISSVHGSPSFVNDTVIRTRDKLQNDIVKLSLDLQNIITLQKTGSVDRAPLLGEVDHNWLCYNRDSDLSSNVG